MGLVTKPYTFTNGVSNIIDAVQVNADFDTLYTLVNGLLTDANAAADAWTDRVIKDGAFCPAGAMMPYGGAAAPTGWLLCDGAAVSRTTYSVLFAVVGTAYGAGDGSTTFNVPDLRGRVPVGEDGAAARLTANDARGQSGGEEKHVLDGTELPRSSGAPNDGSDIAFRASLPASLAAGGHNNMQPYQVVNWIVRTGI